jgi:HSP20 family molecular chaperone IbpA
MKHQTEPPMSEERKRLFLERMSRMFLTDEVQEVSTDSLTAAEGPLNVGPDMSTSDAIASPVAGAKPSSLLERLSFRGTPDSYVVKLAALSVDKKAVSILVMRTSAIITVVQPSKPSVQGNVIPLFAKPSAGKRCQVQFADPVAQKGHTASLKDGVLTVVFVKEKAAGTPWAEKVEIS